MEVLHKLHGNLFEPHNILKKPSPHKIKDNVQQKKGLFYFKNEFSRNWFAKEILAEKGIIGSHICGLSFDTYSILDHFY